MANLTITVDAALLKQARKKALDLDTSVNRYLAEKLAEFVGTETPARETAVEIPAERADVYTESLGNYWR